MNILVTGCGGDIGTNIGRILKKYNLKCYGIDINDNHIGKYIFTECFKICRADNHNYIDEITNLVKKHNISLIIPCTEIEIKIFQNYKIDNVDFLICNKQFYDIGTNKYLTNKFLKDNNLDNPITYELNLENKFKLNYPFILKSKCGCGSKTVRLIEDEKMYEYILSKIDKLEDYIIQEYINGLEYTCCIYKNKDVCKTITMERTLCNGMTKSGQVVNNKIINNLLDKIIKLIEIVGSVNIQLRIKGDKAYIFEINPRFSSTIFFRHLLNFNDLIWFINDKLNLNLEHEEYNKDKIIGKKFCYSLDYHIL
jgi:carbamoyl-phosphate synthase large subunit